MTEEQKQERLKDLVLMIRRGAVDMSARLDCDFEMLFHLLDVLDSTIVIKVNTDEIE